MLHLQCDTSARWLAQVDSDLNAILIDHARLLEPSVEALCDTSCADWVPGQEDERRVVAWLGVEMNLRHGRSIAWAAIEAGPVACRHVRLGD